MPDCSYPILRYQKTFKREVEVENWIKKYDEEMGEKQVNLTFCATCIISIHVCIVCDYCQDELEMLEEQFTEEKKQLKDLEEKLAVVFHLLITLHIVPINKQH